MPANTHDLTLTSTEVRKRYVKWDRGEPEQEWSCLTLLAQHAPGTAPKPLRRATSTDGHPIVIMQRLPGQPLGDAPLTADQTTALGHTLRHLYDIPLHAIHAARIGERTYGPTTYPTDAVRQWLTQPHDTHALHDPALVARATHTALNWLDTHQPPQPHLTAFGIADLNPANILWDGHTCRLVDFEDAGLTDPAYELADHAEHLAGRIGQVFDTDALVDAVALTTTERARMQAYRPLWAAYWLAMLLPGNPGFHRNPPGTTETQATHVLTLLD